MESRKKDHIDLAFQSQVPPSEIDQRFYYEPMLAGHPGLLKPFTFLRHTLRVPIWVSSMTGGTQLAGRINRNLAAACKDFGMGMGLGSCRILLNSDASFDDFNMRPVIGNELPLYANLGISQVEQLVENGHIDRIDKLLLKLKADGLIIHINPLQEWLQPEGDRIKQPPIETIERLLTYSKHKLIVKEVGQGMGPESLMSLMKLPLDAIEFAASGGTNFAKLELLRAGETEREFYSPVSRVGHTAEEMTSMVNNIIDSGTSIACKHIIISGGIKNYLDGYYLIQKSKMPAVYGQASTLLKYAAESYEALHTFLDFQVKGLSLAYNYLTIK
jgi:isopentenyl-diphosphate Delta-isomerase